MGRYDAFIRGMHELGYIEGKNLTIEARFADSETSRLPDLASELVRLNVDAIIATGTPTFRALQKATTTIPVVITASADPVGEGFAKSLARPGGNFTGLSTSNADVFPKQIELLMTVVPKLTRIAVLGNPTNDAHAGRLKNIQNIAQKVGIKVMPVDARTIDEVERGIAAMAHEHAGAFIFLPDTFFVQQMQQIARLALKHRLPSIFATRQYAEAGGLMTYGQNITDNFYRAATYLDKIFKGAKPGELPIEQPTKYELVLNAGTAKAIGLKIPNTILMRTDQVID